MMIFQLVMLVFGRVYSFWLLVFCENPQHQELRTDNSNGSEKSKHLGKIHGFSRVYRIAILYVGKISTIPKP